MVSDAMERGVLERLLAEDFDGAEIYRAQVEATCVAGERDRGCDTVDLGRYAPEVESAVYYSCLEAIQNATRTAAPTCTPP